MDSKVGKDFKINNHTDMDVNALSGEITRFYPYVKEKLGFDKPVIINLLSDPENSKNIFGKTAQYSPSDMTIDIFVDGRHPKDILRSLSHELVHHAQNCRGDFDNLGSTEQGYAQKNPFLRKLEAEAYLLGNGLLFRDFEDMRKSKMKTNENKFNLKDMIRKVLKETLNNATSTMEEDAYEDEAMEEQSVERINFPPQRIRSLRGTPKPRLTRRQMRLAKQGDAEAKAAVQARRDWVKANRKGRSVPSRSAVRVVDAGLGERERKPVESVPNLRGGGERSRIADMAADRKKSDRMSSMLNRLKASPAERRAANAKRLKTPELDAALRSLDTTMASAPEAPKGEGPKNMMAKDVSDDPGVRVFGEPSPEDKKMANPGLRIREAKNNADNRSDKEWYNDTLFENLVKKWTK